MGVYGSGVTLGVYGSGMALGVYDNGRLEAEITAGLAELPGVFIAGIEALGVYGSGVAWEFMAPEWLWEFMAMGV